MPTTYKDYKHIRAWGEFLKLSESYIISEQRHAFQRKAPIETIFWNELGQRWVMLDSIQNQSTVDTIEALVKSYDL